MKLSIITINYNNAEGLRKTMESVLAQTYTEIEYIIVDGASTDGSVDVIREYEQSLASRLSPLASRLKWISEKDRGIYNAMNKGIEIALGKRIVDSFNRSEALYQLQQAERAIYSEHSERSIASATSELKRSDYIQILNSGDILAADDVTERMMAALAAQCAEIKDESLKIKGEETCETVTSSSRLSPLTSNLENCPAIFYGNMIKQYPDGRRVVDRCLGYSKTKEQEVVLRETEWTMYDFIKGTINHDPTYIRRDIYEKYGLYDENLKIVSDWKWFVQAVVMGGEHVYYIPMDVTIFDMTGISETNLMARENERRTELEKMFPMAILKDYDAYHFPINQIQRLKRHHMWSIVYFAERVLFKLEKWGMLKTH